MPELTSLLILNHHALIERFAIEADGQRVAFLSYTLERRRTMTIDIVATPHGESAAMRERLLAAACRWARENGYTALACCPEAREYLRRQKELQLAA